MKVKCCVCGAAREREQCDIIQPSPAQKAAIVEMGQVPAAEYIYCKPCSNLLKNKEQGAALIRGITATRLRMAGNPRAEYIAQKTYEYLIAKATKPVS